MKPTWHLIIFIDPRTLAATSAGLFSETRVTQIGRYTPRGIDKKQATLATFRTYEEAEAHIKLGTYNWLKPIWNVSS